MARRRRSPRTRVRRVYVRAKRTARRQVFPGLSFLLGSAGCWIAEEIEQKQIRPYLDKKLGTQQSSVTTHGVVDLGIGFLASKLAYKIRGVRPFVQGFAYTLGSKGIGKIKEGLTGKSGFL